MDAPWTTNRTIPHGISGALIVGEYDAGGHVHGFLYDGSSWTTLDVPDAEHTFATGVSGDTVVGDFFKSGEPYRGFIYRAGAYTVLDAPLAGTGILQGTWITGISGETIVGYYADSNNVFHGFLATLIGPPRLSITDGSGLLKVSWPYPSTGWSLQENAGLGTTNWTAGTGVSNDGTNNVLTLAFPANSLFFRLAHQ